jgi:hypothetical protein
MNSILIFSLSYTVQSIIFIIIIWQFSYPCAFTQLVPNITFKQPPQHPVPPLCTVHNSSVSTFLPWNCFLQCHMKCVVVNRNIYITISTSIEKYHNEGLNLVLKKIMKKNMRQIPYTEVMFTKFWQFYICYKKITKTVGSTVVDTWWQLTFSRVTEEEHDKTEVDRAPLLVSPCPLTFSGIGLGMALLKYYAKFTKTLGPLQGASIH